MRINGALASPRETDELIVARGNKVLTADLSSDLGLQETWGRVAKYLDSQTAKGPRSMEASSSSTSFPLSYWYHVGRERGADFKLQGEWFLFIRWDELVGYTLSATHASTNEATILTSNFSEMIRAWARSHASEW